MIVAPLTSKGQPLDGKQTRILLDQLRGGDKLRLTGKMGEVKITLWHPLLLEMLA